MLCLVRQANAVILEVEVDAKAKGQECLDKVCHQLGIIEVDYFGLQFAGQHGEMLWLNMRNQIKQQLQGPAPYRLQLRVKFFVPPHLLLQDVTRHQFYINILQDLQENRLRVTDKNLAIKLTALIAQSEIGDLEPDIASSALLSYPKWIPFSILNNELSACSPVTHRRGKRRKHHSGEHHSGASEPEVTENEESFGDSESNSPTEPLLSSEELSELTQAILQEHMKLEGTKTNHAKYLFLQEVANIDDFGVEHFSVKSNTSSEETYRIGVGPKGVVISSEETNEIRHSMPYSSIHMATHSGRCFFLTYIESDGETQALGFRLESGLAANAIYRSVTEKHAFYSCETVRNAVTSQFIRDLKGTIVSLFNENTALGKNYVFDIRRTCREVYDHTRRVLYQLETKANEAKCTQMKDQDCNAQSFFDLDKFSDKTLCRKSQCKDVKDRLATLQDSMLCRICMDTDVCTAFFPCGHVVCCWECASHCDLCPLCRSKVDTTQRIYLPVNGKVLHQLACDGGHSEEANCS